jgi:uncharacterized protein YerC
MSTSNISIVGNKDSYLKIEEDGWIIKHNGSELRVFDDLSSIEVIQEVAEWISRMDGGKIDLFRAWVLLNNLKSRWKPSIEDVRKMYRKIIGEDCNIKLAILSLFTLKLEKPEERIMGVIVKGSNSSGKSYFSKNILKPFEDRVDEFTRMTGAFVERRFKEKDVNGRIFFIHEAGDGDKSIPSQLHISLSEGKLKIGICEKNGGKWKDVEVEAKGYPFFWTTTTKVALSQDITDRCIEICIDESEEQTRKIAEFIVKLDSDYELKEKIEGFENGCFKIFRNYLWDKTPDRCKVVIPFMVLVGEELLKYELPVKFRRDIRKLIALIKAHAILNWRDRVKVDLDSGKIIPKGEPEDIDRFWEEYEKNGYKPRFLVIAEWEDFIEVYKLMETSLKPTLTSLDEKDWKIIRALREVEEEPEASTYQTIHKKTGIPTPTIRILRIPKLENLGIVSVDRDVKPHRITLMKDPLEFQLNIECLKPKAEEIVRGYIEKLDEIILKMVSRNTKNLYTYSLNGENQDSGSSRLEGRVSQVTRQVTQDSGSSKLENRGEGFFDMSSSSIGVNVSGKVYKDESNGGSNTLESKLEVGLNNTSKICGSCIHYQGLKCSKNPSWITISPYSSYAEKCSYYNARPP